MYSLTRSVLFKLSPEFSHELSLEWLGAAERLKLFSMFCSPLRQPVTVMGLEFPNPVGLAAGLDKNADYFNALGALGFGFVEVGTVTPLPQPGNPSPRLFRLAEERAIINRMGFNNLGVEHLVERVRQRRYKGVLGINIGKNKATPEAEALSDYLKGLDAVYACADYVTVNISSPNTPGLRNLQFGDSLRQLLMGLKQRQRELSEIHQRYVPIAVKISPDMSQGELHSVADCLLQAGVDGVIATNTTVSRAGVESSPFSQEAGGLSGEPLQEQSTWAIKTLADKLEGRLPIIGVGGIMSGEGARQKFAAGAALVQLYTGFIYEGPSLIKESVEAFRAHKRT